MKVLVSDKLSDAGLKIFKDAKGIELINQPGLGKDVEKLKEVIADVEAIAIRSDTKLTADVLKCAKKLRVIGRAGIGVDNVDKAQASQQGIIVMNTPFGNTVTTAEHAISMMCALTRSIPQATASIKEGKWEKNRFMGSEMYQKNLGVIGLGNIGRIVADRGLGFKMKVIAYDPFITDEVASQLGVEKVELDDLFQRADYITIHVPKTEKTTNLINREAINKMKKGVFIINCARGGIVDELALLNGLEEGKIAGAALDVFEKEPVDPNNPLLKSDKVICTPHLGASTDEAQENVALDVAYQIVDFLLNGTIKNALNVPSVSGEVMKKLAPYLELAEKLGKLQGQLSNECPQEIKLEISGDLIELPSEPIKIAVLKGVLEPVLEDVNVNLVNAPMIAKERGIKVVESKSSENAHYSSLVKVTLKFKSEERIVAGTVFGKDNLRLVQFDDYHLEAVPQGQILVILNEDKPGVVGNVGTALARANINISRMQLGLSPKTKKATAFYNIEGNVTDTVIEQLEKLSGIISVRQINL